MPIPNLPQKTSKQNIKDSAQQLQEFRVPK